ncbi:hypothetical protein PENTCL1PPCAC_10429, partial [Pristionchus entomophagus]
YTEAMEKQPKMTQAAFNRLQKQKAEKGNEGRPNRDEHRRNEEWDKLGHPNPRICYRTLAGKPYISILISEVDGAEMETLATLAGMPPRNRHGGDGVVAKKLKFMIVRGKGGEIKDRRGKVLLWMEMYGRTEFNEDDKIIFNVDTRVLEASIKTALETKKISLALAESFPFGSNQHACQLTAASNLASLIQAWMVKRRTSIDQLLLRGPSPPRNTIWFEASILRRCPSHQEDE